MLSAGVHPLSFIKSKITTAVGHETLEDYLLLSVERLYGDGENSSAVPKAEHLQTTLP